jgi:photoactive yellow protein
MEYINFESVNLAELLPRIPDSIKNNLPFGLVRLDMTGVILEYNMAEGELTGVDPKWALGKNFFDEVAVCTKTPAFYGRFVEGVKKGFVNAVFEYLFDHAAVATKVKVHMFSMPDSKGQKSVMILVKRSGQPLVVDAIPEAARQAAAPRLPAKTEQPTDLAATTVMEIVSSVVGKLNQEVLNQEVLDIEIDLPAAATPSVPAKKTGGARHEDIFKF